MPCHALLPNEDTIQRINQLSLHMLIFNVAIPREIKPEPSMCRRSSLQRRPPLTHRMPFLPSTQLARARVPSHPPLESNMCPCQMALQSHQEHAARVALALRDAATTAFPPRRGGPAPLAPSPLLPAGLTRHTAKSGARGCGAWGPFLPTPSFPPQRLHSPRPASGAAAPPRLTPPWAAPRPPHPHPPPPHPPPPPPPCPPSGGA